MPALTNALSQVQVVQVVASVDAANTAAATSAAIDLSGYEGSVTFVVNGGVVTAGSLTPKLQDCATSGGSYADVTGATASAISTASQVRSITVDTRSVKQFVKFVGTIATGPVQVAVTMVGFKKVK